jgi:hypothetical protein
MGVLVAEEECEGKGIFSSNLCDFSLCDFGAHLLRKLNSMYIGR